MSKHIFLLLSDDHRQIKLTASVRQAAGRLIAHVLASVAQYENEVRSERILAGQPVAKPRLNNSGIAR